MWGRSDFARLGEYGALPFAAPHSSGAFTVCRPSQFQVVKTLPPLGHPGREEFAGLQLRGLQTLPDPGRLGAITVCRLSQFSFPVAVLHAPYSLLQLLGRWLRVEAARWPEVAAACVVWCLSVGSNLRTGTN